MICAQKIKVTKKNLKKRKRNVKIFLILKTVNVQTVRHKQGDHPKTVLSCIKRIFLNCRRHL